MPDFKNFVTAHSHPGSLDTASTPAAFIKREKELETGAMTVTDHGTLAACPQVYGLARKAGLTPILGLEAYFRDDDCPILREAGIVKRPESEKDTARVSVSHYQKYFHATLHALDQDGYETLGRILSLADARAERHGSERKPLFGWNEMEELGSKNITMGSSCLVGVVQRHLLAGKPDLAIKYYDAFRKLMKPGNFYVEVFPHRCTHDWVRGVFFHIAGKTSEEDQKLSYYMGKKFRMQLNGVVIEDHAEKLAAAWEVALKEGRPECFLLARADNRKWVEFPEPLRVADIEAVEDFLQNECTELQPDGDVQRSANKFMLWLAKKRGDPILISDDSHFAHPEDKVVQDVRLLSGDKQESSAGQKTWRSVANWRFYGSYHRQSSAEAFAYFRDVLGIREAQFGEWVQNSHDWAKRFGWTWKPRSELPTKFYPKDTLTHTMSLIKKVGRMQWKNPQWRDRLASEIKMLHQNGTIDLLPYFFLDEDIVSLYERHGVLTGAGRGSAAGLLLAYCLGITHVDPLRYDLSKERFLTESRIRSGKLPDIDQDLPDRELLVSKTVPGKGYFYEKFDGHFAQVSNDTRLRLRNSAKDVHRMRDGVVPPEVEKLIGGFPKPPQGVEDLDFVFGYKGPDGDWIRGAIETDKTLQFYAERYPKHWALVQQCLGLTRNKSRHACAFVITNEPVINFLPTTRVGSDGGPPVTQYTKDFVEQVGGLKMDFLEVLHLKFIQSAVKLVQQACGYDPKDEVIGNLRVPGIRVVPVRLADGSLKLYDVWDLPEDQNVFADMCNGRTESTFQFSTPGVRGWLMLFRDERGDHTLRSIEHISALTALDRPGPLDAFVEDSDNNIRRNMLEEFASRSKGGKPVGGNPQLDALFPETYGVLTYQEQLQKCFQVIGQTSAEQGDDFRVHVSKKKADMVAKDREVFMPGAVRTFGSVEEAERIWGMLCTFAAYGFNKSHAVCYAITGYVGAWMKHHYPIEWWTGVLQNSDRTKIDNTFWEFCGSNIDPPDIKVSADDFTIQNARIRAPLRLISGLGPKAHDELVELRPFADVKEFCQKVYERRKAKGTVQVKQKTNKKTGLVTEVKTLKLGRSDLNKTVLAKLIISGCCDSLFPDTIPQNDIDRKLAYFAEVKAEVEGKKKPEEVDPRFLNLSTLQRFQLRKDVLTSFSADLVPWVAEKLGRDEFQADPGYRNAWLMPREFEGNSWCPIVHGSEARQILEDDGSGGLNPKFKFGVVAFITGVERFWNGKAARIHFEVNGERFEYVKWPNKREKENEKPADLPPDFKGSVSILTLGRWRMEKGFTIDDVRIVSPALTMKSGSAEDAE